MKSSEHPKHAGEKRGFGRLRCDALESSLGEVLDLSSTGLRVKVGRRIDLKSGQELDLDLRLGELAGSFKARVIWVRKVGWRRTEAGVQFDAIDPQQRATLTRLATCARDRLSVAWRQAS